MKKNMQHRLLTPLTVIRGNTDIVLQKANLGRTERAALSSIVRAVEKLAKEIRLL